MYQLEEMEDVEVWSCLVEEMVKTSVVYLKTCLLRGRPCIEVNTRMLTCCLLHVDVTARYLNS